MDSTVETASSNGETSDELSWVEVGEPGGLAIRSRHDRLSRKTVNVLLACRRRLTILGVQAMFSTCEEINLLGLFVIPQQSEWFFQHERVDVVLCHWDDYGARSQETIRQIRERSPETRIVVLSQRVDARAIRESFLMGATGFVAETCNDEEIIDAIIAAADGRFSIESGVLSQTDRVIDPDVPSPDCLTAREIDVLTLVAVGLSTKQIGAALFLSPKTVETHRANLMRKLDIVSIADLVRYAMVVGLVVESDTQEDGPTGTGS